MLASLPNHHPRVKRQHDEVQEPCNSSKRQRYTATGGIGSPTATRSSSSHDWLTPAPSLPPVQQQPSAPQPLQQPAAVFAWLRQRFPEMDDKVVGDVLHEFGNDIDGAIKKLEQLTLSRRAQSQAEAQQGATPGASQAAAAAAAGVSISPSPPPPPQPQPPQPSADEWVDYVVSSMTSGFASREAANGKAREVLGKLESCIVSRVTAEAGTRVAELQRENYVLKRAVQIQNNKLLAAEEARARLEATHQQQIRALEMANYSLGVHLREATSGGIAAGHRRPDVF